MWLIMILKGCQNLKMLNDGCVFPRINRFIWEHLQDITLLHGYLPIETSGAPSVGSEMMVHACYKFTTKYIVSSCNRIIMVVII